MIVMHMDEKTKILGIAGSLRKDSYNKALLKVIAGLAPAGVEIEVFELDSIPLYNQDIDTPELMPQSVRSLKDKIKKADAVLFVTPEYNRSMPGVLKNAIDWASRPYNDNSFDDKPVATIGATDGMLGTAVAQYHMREIFSFLNAHPMERPQLFVSGISKKIVDGNIQDEELKKLLMQFIENLVAWAARINNGKV
ncbi:glycerol-3-phosphate dehydrogenase (NAD(P)(+)) [mine drainage metagenome]|uniref:Glycerol-3-phosphate dehydrogenase (NAD(P)(+)) n=2 Tax=mine drainage metagenome TaxID=410659 RepID=T1A5L5_9ZZZZ